MIEKDYLNDFLDAIYEGDVDEYLTVITNSIKSRESALKEDMRRSISSGDIVRFNTSVSPKYLSGLRAEVKGFAKKNITVEIVESDKPYARRYARGSFRTPIGLVDKVDA